MPTQALNRWSLTGALVGLAIAQAVAQAPAASYVNAVSARIVSPICSSGVFIDGNTSGDLKGSFAASFACADESIVGGSWRVVVTEAGPDGTSTEVGALSGRVVQGSFQRDVAGQVSALSEIQLEIREGTGRYASVDSGTGTLGAIVDPNADPQVRGALDLSF